MLRRRFLDVLTRAGAGGALALQTRGGRANSAVAEFDVSGFTCVTCAVGLESLLAREMGVVGVKASYADRRARVKYLPAVITEQVITQRIEAMGFQARRLPADTTASAPPAGRT